LDGFAGFFDRGFEVRGDFWMVFGGHNVVLMRIVAVVSCPHFGTEKHATPFDFIFGRTNLSEQTIGQNDVV
jgi:hypothetical protein